MRRWRILLLRILFGLTLSTCTAPVGQSESARVRVKIDREVTIVPPGAGTFRAMLGMVRDGNGTIFVNTQTRGLAVSSDEGQTWKQMPVKLPDAPADQSLQGLGVTRKGRLLLLHQTVDPSHQERVRSWKDLFISTSTNGGQTWKTLQIDFAKFAPAVSEFPYAFSYNDYNTFIEQPDGTLMCSVGLSYPPEYAQRHDTEGASFGGQFMIRSSDGGKTWHQPTLIHRFVAEVGHAIDPKSPRNILSMTRIQRKLLVGEDRSSLEARTGCPPEAPWVYKQGLLLKSRDGGHSFQEVSGGLTEYYGHRGTILWTPGNVVVVTHQGGVPRKSESDGQLFARISLDGGQNWLDDTGGGTPLMNRSKKFLLVATPPGHSFTAPTIELSPNFFLTGYATSQERSVTIRGVFWHLEERS